VQALLESRLLLLFIEEGPAARGILTGKLFEYLGSGVPILALAPEGEAAEMIRSTRGGRVVPGDDAEGVAAALREAFAAFRRDERPFGEPDRGAILRTSRPALTAQLAELFRRVLSERAPAPEKRGS
jgi:glycosyltransferase involved in cell wall biosynthesis